MMQAMKVQSVGRSGKGVVKGSYTCFFGVENLEDEDGPPPKKKMEVWKMIIMFKVVIFRFGVCRSMRKDATKNA